MTQEQIIALKEKVDLIKDLNQLEEQSVLTIRYNLNKAFGGSEKVNQAVNQIAAVIREEFGQLTDEVESYLNRLRIVDDNQTSLDITRELDTTNQLTSLFNEMGKGLK